MTGGGRASAGGRLSVAAANVEDTDEMKAGTPGSSVLRCRVARLPGRRMTEVRHR